MKNNTIDDHEIINCIPAMIFIATLNPHDDFFSGRFAHCNKALLHFIGYKEKDIIEQGFHFLKKIIHPDDFASCKEVADNLLSGKKNRCEAYFRVLPKNRCNYVVLKGECHLLKPRTDGSEYHFVNTMSLVDESLEMEYWEETQNKRNRNSVIIKNRLTACNLDHARLLVAGKTNKEIAATLFTSESTAKWHRAEIKRRLNITNMVQLVHFLKEGGVE